MRTHGEFFANYARSKAEAERLVCAANEIPKDPLASGGFRTGSIRPGNAIYGQRGDFMVSPTLRMGIETLTTFTAPWMQNWVHAGNVGLAHLQYEAALLGPHAHRVAARPYLVTDPGPPHLFNDYYTLVQAVSATRFHVQYPPPLALLILAHMVEAYCVMLWRFPILTRWLSEPSEPLAFLQPACFDASTNCIMDDSDARKEVADGGIGYKGACGSMEGLCLQLVKWNEYVERERRAGRGEWTYAKGEKGIVKSIVEDGVEPAAA